jgi:hypothetical protein
MEKRGQQRHHQSQESCHSSNLSSFPAQKSSSEQWQLSLSADRVSLPLFPRAENNVYFHLHIEITASSRRVESSFNSLSRRRSMKAARELWIALLLMYGGKLKQIWLNKASDGARDSDSSSTCTFPRLPKCFKGFMALFWHSRWGL